LYIENYCKFDVILFSQNQIIKPSYIYMLWFKFILGLMFFELVSIIFAIVPHYGNEYMTKENKNWTSSKSFAPKLDLNHNIYINSWNWLPPFSKCEDKFVPPSMIPGVSIISSEVDGRPYESRGL